MPVSPDFANSCAPRHSNGGYSLVELLVVCTVIAIIAVLFYSRAFSSNSTGGFGTEQVLSVIETRIGERRSEALRLNSLVSPNSLEMSVPVPLEIDFARPETTASLVTDGADADDDGTDDMTGEQLTTVVRDGTTSSGHWRYVYRQDKIELPAGWRILRSLDGMPFPAVGTGGRGTPVSRISFDAEGRAVYPVNSSIINTQPAGGADSRFWAIYLVFEPSLQTAAPVALALGIYPSGLTERFFYDNGSWTGFKRRTTE